MSTPSNSCLTVEVRTRSSAELVLRSSRSPHAGCRNLRWSNLRFPSRPWRWLRWLTCYCTCIVATAVENRLSDSRNDLACWLSRLVLSLRWQFGQILWLQHKPDLCSWLASSSRKRCRQFLVHSSRSVLTYVRSDYWRLGLKSKILDHLAGIATAPDDRRIIRRYASPLHELLVPSSRYGSSRPIYPRLEFTGEFLATKLASKRGNRVSTKVRHNLDSRLWWW